MNNRFLSGILLLFLVLINVSANAENVYDPDELLKIADEQIFQRIGPSYDFSENQGYVNEILENGVIHQRYIYDGKGTDTLLSLFPVSEEVVSGSKYLKFANAGLKNFHAALTVHRVETVPEDVGGGCWIRISNILMTGSGREKGLVIVPGNRALEVNAGTQTDFYDLSGLDMEKPIKLDFIRIDGAIYVYADDKYLFCFEDGVSGSVFIDAGSMLFDSGNWVRCDFDDFTVRY